MLLRPEKLTHAIELNLSSKHTFPLSHQLYLLCLWYLFDFVPSTERTSLSVQHLAKNKNELLGTPS